jgi:DNA repair exonuclease SbcCD nuclease subunit
MHDAGYSGLLCIGDPHLASRAPGLRKDDYPRIVLAKFNWCLKYARENRLRPLLLGDLFNYPRDNANWLVFELMSMLDEPIGAIAGNHDCAENALSNDDTLSLLVAGGKLRLLNQRPWREIIGETDVLIGGNGWGESIARHGPDKEQATGLVFWLVHHDIRFPGYEESAHSDCREIPGIDVVINGHIHRALPTVVCGQTTWINPGNIARVSCGDASRLRKPAVLRIDIEAGRWTSHAVEVPHQPFEEVFHLDASARPEEEGDSLFIRGLERLEAIKSASGAGVMEFIEKNVDQFEPPVAAEIRRLAEKVLGHDATNA